MDFYQPVADRMARTLISRGFDPERMCVIYNGMDFTEPVPEARPARHMLRSSGVWMFSRMRCCAASPRA